jgi:hypothetical protein
MRLEIREVKNTFATERKIKKDRLADMKERQTQMQRLYSTWF